MNFEFSNIELEKLFIKVICINTDNIELSIKNITVDNFTNDICRQIYFTIVEHYKQFNSIISIIELKEKLQSKFENKDIFLSFVDSIFNLEIKSNNIQSIISLLKEKTKARNIVKLVQSLGNNVSIGNLEKCDNILNKYLQ